MDDVYAQNVRTLDEYYSALDQGSLPTLRGIQLTADDIIRRELIGELMCQFKLDTKAFGQKHQINFMEYFKDDLEELAELEKADLLTWRAEEIIIPRRGRLLVRRVAMAFDARLKSMKTQARYSKVV